MIESSNRNQLNMDCGELLIIVTPTVQLDDIVPGGYFRLPGDDTNYIKRLVTVREEEIVMLKTVQVQVDPKNQPTVFNNYIVHYSWLRALNNSKTNYKS